MNNYTHISHKDIPIYINPDSEFLILGSLPSVKSREMGFYYSHKRNRFFDVLGRLFKEKCPLTIEERKLFLKRHKIALYDVIERCDIIGSSDLSIKNPKVIDLETILREHPNIKVIGVNGNKALSLFNKYLLDTANRYHIRVVGLPSTSPANARMNIDELVNRYKELFDKISL